MAAFKAKLDETETKLKRAESLLELAYAQIAGTYCDVVEHAYLLLLFDTTAHVAFRAEHPDWRPPDDILLHDEDHENASSIFKVIVPRTRWCV